jgi:6-methylsalicylate decarboxylase
LTGFAERFQIQMVTTPPFKDKFSRKLSTRTIPPRSRTRSRSGHCTGLVPISQIVYGTDYPYRTAAEHTKGLEAAFSGDDLKAIDRENALHIMPRLRMT